MKHIIHTLLALAALIGTGISAEKNELSPEFAKVFADAKEVTLVSISPMYVEDKKDTIHGYRMLGETVLKAKDIESAMGEFREAVKAFDGRYFSCFNPRHVLRAKAGGHTYDILICFECQSFSLFKNQAEILGGGVTGSGKAMNALLTAAKIPLAQLGELKLRRDASVVSTKVR